MRIAEYNFPSAKFQVQRVLQSLFQTPLAQRQSALTSHCRTGATPCCNPVGLFKTCSGRRGHSPERPGWFTQTFLTQTQACCNSLQLSRKSHVPQTSLSSSEVGRVFFSHVPPLQGYFNLLNNSDLQKPRPESEDPAQLSAKGLIIPCPYTATQHAHRLEKHTKGSPC